MNLEEIKTYFGERMVTFPETQVNLNETQSNILYNIGLPNYNGYGGTYIMLDKLELIDNRYLKFATRKGDENTYFRFLDTVTGHVVYKSFDSNYALINTSLENYLIYIFKKVKLPQKLGLYYENDNHQKYANELKKRFLEHNDDVEKGSWFSLIEEMGYGII